MKIVAVVILYNPPEDVIDNIQSYLPYIEKLYVMDNSEKQEKDIIKKITCLSKTSYYFDGVNKGISARLNEAATTALSEGYEWLLTMDQDSCFTEIHILNYIKCVDLFASKTGVSMFGVEYVEKPLEPTACSAVEVEQLITSGSILNLAAFETIGKFDEALFIDEVDLDYCYNSIRKGFKIIKFKNIFLNHYLGTLSYHASLKNLKLTPRTLHSPFRIYYMTRNFLYINKKYKNGFSKDRKIRKKALLNRLKNNFLYGSNRLLLIRLVFEAIWDYKNNKMGKKGFNDS